MSADADDPLLPCAPCGGSGTLISNLGGTPATVTCPWCDGDGVYDPEHDAQAKAPADHRQSEAPPAS